MHKFDANGSWSRRGFLGLAGGFGAISMLPGIARATGAPKRLVVVRADGGWDVTFCMDPRLSSSGVDGPDAVSNGEVIASYGGLPIMANAVERPNMDAFFSAHAGETIVINGISVGSIVHEECRLRIATGSRLSTSADMACLSAVAHGSSETLPYLDLTGGGRVGPHAAMAGSLGRNNQILGLLDRELEFPAPGGASFPRYTPQGGQRTALDEYLDVRRGRFADRLGARAATARVDTLGAAMDRQRALMDSTLLQQGLSFGQAGSLSSQCELAASLMASDFCHSASVDSGRGWDTHDDITEQHGLFDDLFQGLNSLVDALQVEGIWNDTIVVVISEMTRTPKLNADGGKDHWPNTSALVFGGGLDGGRVLGGTTTSTLDALPVNLESGQVDESRDTVITYGRFAAGVLHAAGVDTSVYMPDEEVLHGIVDG